MELRTRDFPTVYCNLVMVLYGLSAVMIGTTLPEMIRQFDLSLARGGFVITVQSAGGILSLLAAGLFADRVSKSAVLSVAFGALGLAWFATGLTRSYPWLLTTFFLSGAAIRILDVMLNAYVGDLHPEARGFYLNRLHMFFGIGAFAGPMFARFLLDTGFSWRSIYLLVGAVFVSASAAGLRIKTPAASVSSSSRTRTAPAGLNVGELMRRPEILVLGAILLFYIVHQTGITTWFPHHMESSLGSGSRIASFALSLFWIGIIIGRFLAARLTDRIGAARLILVGTAAGGVLLVGGILAFRQAPLLISGFAAGVLTGATIPLAMIVSYHRFPDNTGSSTAVLSLFMMSGRLIGPWLIGIIAEMPLRAEPMVVAMTLTGVALLFCFALAAVGFRRSVDRPVGGR